MKTLIKVEKEDIVTNRLGCNVEVQIDEKLSIVFSADALDELVKDYSAIKTEIEDSRGFHCSGFPEEYRPRPQQLEIPFDDVDNLIKDDKKI
jgi:hypothetical protein